MTGEHLPNAVQAVVPERKITDYLLSETHPDGRGKARFFIAHGFSVAVWQVLADALKHHAVRSVVVETVTTAFGDRYVLEGILHTPDGRTPDLRTVWFVERGEDAPRLVTAYPVRRR